MIEKNIKYLGIDWGEAKIGLAIGDSETKLAMPFGIAKNIDEVLSTAKEEEVDALVVGKPVSLSGEQDSASSGYLAFINKLMDSGLHVSFVDERLTTKEAQVLMRGTGHAGKDDAVAAMLILQSFFDQIQSLKSPSPL